MKQQTINTEFQINEEEIGKLPETEFRIMTVKMIKNLENKMEKMKKSVNKGLEELKNKHTNNTIAEIKNTLEGINRRICEAEERISERGDKMLEITSEEQNKVKIIKRTEDSLRDLWDNVRHTNIQTIGFPAEEEKKKAYKKNFEVITVENFHTMGKEIVNQVQERQRVPYRINPRRNMASHILIKITKIKYKEEILKAAREKQQVTYKGNPIPLTADLSAETAGQKGREGYT